MAGGGRLACVDLHVLSLMPRTLSSRYAAIVAPGEMSEDKELEALKSFFKSTISGGRMEAKLEAKGKANDSFETISDIGNKIGDANLKNQMQGLRPGLGRKRARFTFNPNTGDSRLHVDKQINFDHIKDPEEFFAAVERTEYADKVLKKIRGETEDKSNTTIMLTPMKQRPGILGKRTSYKGYFRTQLEHIETNSRSQCENQASRPFKSISIDSTSTPISLPRIQCGTSQAGKADATSTFNASELQGSPAKEDKSVDCILNDILYAFEDVKEGEEIEFLEKRLQIKSINVEKVCLPPLDRCHGNNFLITDGQSPQKVLGLPATDSRSAACSPLASLAALKRRILRKDLLDDPFYMESPSDSSSENSSSNEGSHRQSKTRSRLNSRRDSIIQNVTKTPTSDPLANDIASKTTKDIAENQIDRMLFEDLIAIELDQQGLPSNVQTSEIAMDVDDRTNGDSIKTSVLADNDIEECDSQMADAPVEASVASEADAADEAVHLEERNANLFVETADVVHDNLESPAYMGVKETLASLNYPSDSLSNSFETVAKVSCETNPKEKPRSPVSESCVPATLDNGMNAISDAANIEDLSVVDEGDNIHQEALITNSAGCGNAEFPFGFINQGIPVNADSPEIGGPTINLADNVQQAPLSYNKETEKETKCISAIQEKQPESTIQPSLSTPNRQINGIKYGASNVEAHLTFNFSSEDENDHINEETLIMSGVSPGKKSLETRANADSLEIDDVNMDKVDDNQEGHVSKNKGPGSESNFRSTVQEEQPELIVQHNLATPGNRSSHQTDGIEPNASNVAVPASMNFSSEDENDDINEETLIITEVGVSPVIRGVNADTGEIGNINTYKANDDQEAHGSNNKESYTESISRASIQKERPESTMQPRNISTNQIDGIQLDGSTIAGPAAINFSCEDENDGVNDDTLVMNKAGAPPDEIHVDYSVDAESQEMGYIVTDKATFVHEADASNRRDYPVADSAKNIPAEGCSGSSSLLNEPIPEVQEENQPNSDPAVKVAPRKRQSKQKQKNRRQSLAGAGTAWQSGVRRSTRIRTKPLAHWRGERIIYGRIHETLPTMIGMKYASPGKSNQKVPPPLKVKSFVSEEHADLLHRIALH